MNTRPENNDLPAMDDDLPPISANPVLRRAHAADDSFNQPILESQNTGEFIRGTYDLSHPSNADLKSAATTISAAIYILRSMFVVSACRESFFKVKRYPDDPNGGAPAPAVHNNVICCK